MLTKNAKKFLLYAIMNSNATGQSDPQPALSFTITSIDGVEQQVQSGNKIQTASFINSLNHMTTSTEVDVFDVSKTYIRCGTGTTAATEDDYNLEMEATGLTCDSVITAIGSNQTKTYTATFSNTTESDIVVTEIGFFTKYYYRTNANYDNFLLDHIILDTPITIPAGESKAITYELGF